MCVPETGSDLRWLVSHSDKRTHHSQLSSRNWSVFSICIDDEWSFWLRPTLIFRGGMLVSLFDENAIHFADGLTSVRSVGKITEFLQKIGEKDLIAGISRKA